MELPDGLDGVSVFGLLVVPISYHARKSECQAARIVRAVLQTIERDFDDELRPDVDDVPFPAHLDLLEPLRLPREQLVRHALECLAEHYEAPVWIAGAEVQVRQPAVAAAVAPFGGEHDEIERIGLL